MISVFPLFTVSFVSLPFEYLFCRLQSYCLDVRVIYTVNVNDYLPFMSLPRSFRLQLSLSNFYFLTFLYMTLLVLFSFPYLRYNHSLFYIKFCSLL